MDNVMVFDHPLIQHKISILRNKATGTNEFRALIEEIAMLMGYEALRDLPLEDVEVETPIETCMTPHDCRTQTGRGSDSPCRTWHGKRHFGSGSQRKGRSYRFIQGRGGLTNLMNITANCRIPLIKD